MNPKSWQQIKEIFSEAVELPEPKRKKFLSRKCGKDETLLREVEKLLLADSHENAVEFLEQPILKNLPTSDLNSEITVTNEHLSICSIMPKRHLITDDQDDDLDYW